MSKGKKKSQMYVWILIFIFLIVLGTRLYFAFSTEHFSSDAYFDMRQIEHIRDTGKPLYNDELSYRDTPYFFTPGFHYVMAFFSLGMPVEIAAKVFPNIFAALLVIITYLIALELTRNKKVGLVAAFVSGFIPVFFSKTINSISVYTLALPLIFLALYFMMLLNKKKKYAIHAIVTMVILMVVHPSIIYLIIGLLFYLMFIKQERIAQTRGEIEVFIFSIFLTIWFYSLMFKNALLEHGASIIYTNIPQALISGYFANFNLLNMLLLIGLVPFLLGLYVMYKYTFKERKRNLYLFIGFGISIFLLMWFRWIEITLGVMILGAIMVILFSQYLKNFLIFFEKSKFTFLKNFVLGFLLIIVLLTSVFPSIGYAIQENKKVITNEDIEALKVLKGLSNETNVIVSAFEDSHAISYFAGKKNILDNNFLMVENVDEIYDDIKTIFASPGLIRAITVAQKYDIEFIYFSNNAKRDFKVDKIEYVESNKCVKIVYDGNTKIYDIRECRLKTVIST